MTLRHVPKTKRVKTGTSLKLDFMRMADLEIIKLLQELIISMKILQKPLRRC